MSRAQAVIAAGGLGTRVQPWASILPKEWQPVRDRPGIAVLLQEAADAGVERVIVVHHPYYTRFYQGWARDVLSRGGRAAYRAAAGLADTFDPVGERLDLHLVPQVGAYGDLSSLQTALPLLDLHDPVLMAFSDVFYPCNALAAVGAASSDPEEAVVLARPFDLAEIHARGVLTCKGDGDDVLMTGLVEKPDQRTAERLLAEYGTDGLRLFEGRFRLPADFAQTAMLHVPSGYGEPRLSLALGAWAGTRRVRVVTIDSPMVDLGGLAVPPTQSE